MHLLTILAFAVVFWEAEEPSRWVLVPQGDRVLTLAAVVLQPMLMAVAAWLVGRRARKVLNQGGGDPEAAQHAYHRGSLALRTAALLAFTATVFLTHWTDWLAFGSVHPALQIVGDLIVLAPFVLSVLVLWVVVYPLERELRGQGWTWLGDVENEPEIGWRFHAYLDFHVRHYLLVVAVPMMVILFAANLTRGYSTELRAWFHSGWAPDVLLGVVAAGVFLVAPVVLRRIWRTRPLEDGPMRRRLETLCERVGFRCREILVWDSDGIMINAAVMGIIAPVRYVMLSDALLATMSPSQVEAVFGHEIGHVRHRHIPFFLLFALMGWVLVGALMELLALGSIQPDAPLGLSVFSIQVVGVVATVAFWGFGFGWVSRRFERQADVFAARNVMLDADDCDVPCAVHPGEQTTRSTAGRVCATGAALFAAALNRVALLNGIPHEERSWRHSSIGSRVRFLHELAGDPHLAAAFDRTLLRIKRTLLLVAILGAVCTILYWQLGDGPAILRMEAGGVTPHVV